MKAEGKQKPEAELCRRFVEWVETTSDWVCYAETGGYDLVLVSPTGVQVGVHAKKAMNWNLLRQVIGDNYADTAGPDYRAVVVPSVADRRQQLSLCEGLGIVMFYENVEADTWHRFAPALSRHQDWTLWGTEKRIKLPEYVPDVEAGASGPVQLTEWKVKALRLIARMQVCGGVTRKDFHDIGLDHRRWTNPMSKWAVLRDGRYHPGPNLHFAKQHPGVFAKILENERKQAEKSDEFSDD